MDQQNSLTDNFRFLAHILHNPDIISKYNISDKYFVSNVIPYFQTIQSLEYKTIPELKSKCLSNNLKPEIADLISKYYNEEQLPESIETFNHFKKNLLQLKKQELLSSQIQILKNYKGDEVELNTTIQNIQKIISEVDLELTSSLNEVLSEYIQDLKNKPNRPFHSFGDDLIDKRIFTGANGGEITILGGATSMGKSIVGLHLTNGLINKNVPLMYFGTEMSQTSTMNRLAGIRLNITKEMLYNTSNTQQYNQCIKDIENMQQELLNNNKAYFSFNGSLSLKTLRQSISEFKIKTGSDYAFVIVDLLTMVKEFKSNNFVESYEIAMDELSNIAKEYNVHILGVVQLNKETDNMKIFDIDQLDKVRPTLNSLKGSQSLSARPRQVLTVFRKSYYIKRYLALDEAAQELLANEGDILELSVLKYSDGEAGGESLKYLYDAPHSKITPILSTIISNQTKLCNVSEDLF